MIKFITADNSTGGLTTVRAPAKATAISPDGGWIIKAKPLRNQKGPIIRYPTWIGAYDLQTPVARKRTGAVPSRFRRLPY